MSFWCSPEQFLFIGHGFFGKGLPAAKNVEDNAWQESQKCHLPAQILQKAAVRTCPKSDHKSTGSRSFGSISYRNVTSYFILHHLPFNKIIKIIYTSYKATSQLNNKLSWKCSECFVQLLYARLQMCIIATPISHPLKYKALTRVFPGNFSALFTF